MADIVVGIIVVSGALYIIWDMTFNPAHKEARYNLKKFLGLV